MSSQEFSFRKFIRGFQYAFTGIVGFIRSERNAGIHAAATVLVIVAGIYFRVSTVDAMLIAVAIGLVWMAEMFNTSIEKAMNFISGETRKEIEFIKDVSAGGVLVASLTALAIGLFIFIPKII